MHDVTTYRIDGDRIYPMLWVARVNAHARLRDEIRVAFGSVPFPVHRGLRAAMAMDDWQSDPALLERITAEEDIHAQWWEIPAGELRECVSAIAYLDAAGIEFYLPAYMTLALSDVSRARLWVLNFLDPRSADADPALSEYFRDRLSRLNGEKKQVCITFLEFLRTQWNPDDPLSRPDFIAVSRILEHEFWRA